MGYDEPQHAVGHSLLASTPGWGWVLGIVVAAVLVGLVARWVTRPTGRRSDPCPRCRHWWRSRGPAYLGRAAMIPGPFCARCKRRWWAQAHDHGWSGVVTPLRRSGSHLRPVTDSLGVLDHAEVAREAVTAALIRYRDDGGDDVA